ncbi:MAG: hypothetical protein CL677_01690 [Bdellovibrionaceae bacterium]|nr:hypothetical protein [Pseudobdellovibrionaceae bacterium]|tara:strand:- start:107803 stop:108375 length:573 start_codon:yes stop_codon:yes gene_type:complete
MDNHGVILKYVREQKGLTQRAAAKLADRSPGWLSEVENLRGKSRVSEPEFQRILKAWGNTLDRKKLSTAILQFKNSKSNNVRIFDGAIYKYLREKKNISLGKAASLLGLSKSHLSNIECGKRKITKEQTKKLQTYYGHTPTSFSNLAKNDRRRGTVPSIYKITVLLKSLTCTELDELFNSAISIIEKRQN